MNSPKTLRQAIEANDYDPNALAVDKARELIRTYLSPVAGFERVGLHRALDRVLAQDLTSPIDVPSHDNSAMDGYAVRFVDLCSDQDTLLTRVGDSFAGKPYVSIVGKAECVRIFTGGVMPAGADTVVMQERTTREGNEVRVLANAVSKLGQNRRFAGEDLKRGQTVFSAGQLIRAAELGMLASLGIGEVNVCRKLRVAFFSTGDELKPIGTPLAVGQIYDSNRYTLYGMLKRLGCEPVDMGAIEDDPDKLREAFVTASTSADVVITSGGVSVGEADYVRTLLAELGDVVFWKMAIKPGRPLAYGKIGNAHFFGLPGNPAAVMVTFYQFVREALMLLQGQRLIASPPTFKVRLATPVKKLPGRTEFQRGILSAGAGGEWEVSVTGDQGSGILSSMSRANCFIVLPSDRGNAATGELVEVQLFDGLL